MKPLPKIRHYRTEADEIDPHQSPFYSKQRKNYHGITNEELYYSSTSDVDFEPTHINRVSVQKLHKLEKQLNQIEKLKNEYQNRHTRIIRPYSSKYSDNQRSVQKKHILKPSNSPGLGRNSQITSKSQLTLDKKQDNMNLSKIIESKVVLSESDTEKQNMRKQIQTLKLDLVQKNHMTIYLKERILELETDLTVKLNIIKDISKSKDSLHDEVERLKMENQQIQSILKNMLYERERDRFSGYGEGISKQKLSKLNNSQNTPVHYQRQMKSYTEFRNQPHNLNQQSLKQIEDSLQNNLNPFDKVCIDKNLKRDILIQRKVPNEFEYQNFNQQKQKKQRVQNILDKLKIKINKY